MKRTKNEKSRLVRKVLISVLGFLILSFSVINAEGISIQDFNVLPENSPALNTRNLQKAINQAAVSGTALYIEPSDNPYPLNGGLVLKNGVSLIGVNGPTPRGTCHPSESRPVGSVFKITDRKNVFIKVESGTQIKGIQFWYPEQTLDNPDDIIEYPATIQVSRNRKTQGVYLSCLTFYGEYMAMDFNASPENPCELMLFEHCYGYPLSGEFIRMDYCYDVPRILHCHVNPSIQRFFKGNYKREVIDAVIAKHSYSYSIEHTDNAQLMDLFTFGVFGGIMLGGESYGQLTNFNFDCVSVGVYKKGNNTKNRNWQIAQGSIIANCGDSVENVHPVVIEGRGHTSFTNVEAFSGGNGALTTVPENKSWDFMMIKGYQKLTVSVFGSRMRNYMAEIPLSIKNPNALIQLVACIDKNENLYNKVFYGENSADFPGIPVGQKK